MTLAGIYAGGARSDAALIGGVGLQIVRAFVVRFNAAGPDSLLNRRAPGVPSIFDDHQRQALRQAVEDGHIPATHGIEGELLTSLGARLSRRGAFPRG